jgi:hypothetical protein
MRGAKRIRVRDSLIVQEGNQNKKQSEKQSEKRNKKTKPIEKQNKKGMAAEVKRKMANYEFLMSYSPPLSASQIREISQKITDLINTAITITSSSQTDQSMIS